MLTDLFLTDGQEGGTVVQKVALAPPSSTVHGSILKSPFCLLPCDELVPCLRMVAKGIVIEDE